MNVPESIVSGDVTSWTETLSSYPASTWTLTIVFVYKSNQKTATVTADGDDHDVELDTTNWAAGEWAYQARVTDGSTVTTIDEGYITVKPNFAAVGFDSTSHVQKVLDQIETLIEGKTLKDVQAYTINGRSLSRYTMAELLELRKKYRAELYTEMMADRVSKGLGIPRVNVSFK